LFKLDIFLRKGYPVEKGEKRKAKVKSLFFPFAFPLSPFGRGYPLKDKSIIQDIQQVVNFFTIDLISEIAKATEFIQRLRKLSAITFLGIFTFGLIQQPDASLNQLVSIGKQITPNFNITPEGLHQKITEKAVNFLLALFAKSLKISATAVETFIPILKHFPKVHLLDSTVVSLPEELAEEFSGSGGSASSAAIKFQFMLEYKSGTFSQIWLTAGTQPDQNQIDVAIENIEKGELLIHDLGYFSQDGIVKIEDKEAFFLSRYYPQTVLYNKTRNGNWQRFDLLEALNNSDDKTKEFTVRYGSKAKVSCRLIAKRVTDEVAQRRKRKKRRAAKKKGRTPSKQVLALCHWDLYVTNIPSSWLPKEFVGDVYSIRWQIELVFKAAKSFLGFKLICGKRSPRVLCQIYGRLIVLVLTLFLCGKFRQRMWQQRRRELSFLKCFRHLQIFAQSFLTCLMDKDALIEQFYSFSKEVIRLCAMNKRKSRHSTLHKLRPLYESG
jgi:hypothetical protein